MSEIPGHEAENTSNGNPTDRTHARPSEPAAKANKAASRVNHETIQKSESSTNGGSLSHYIVMSDQFSIYLLALGSLISPMFVKSIDNLSQQLYTSRRDISFVARKRNVLYSYAHTCITMPDCFMTLDP